MLRNSRVSCTEVTDAYFLHKYYSFTYGDWRAKARAIELFRDEVGLENLLPWIQPSAVSV